MSNGCVRSCAAPDCRSRPRISGAERYLALMGRDKKVTAGSLRFVLLDGVGAARIRSDGSGRRVARSAGLIAARPARKFKQRAFRAPFFAAGRRRHEGRRCLCRDHEHVIVAPMVFCGVLWSITVTEVRAGTGRQAGDLDLVAGDHHGPGRTGDGPIAGVPPVTREGERAAGASRGGHGPRGNGESRGRRRIFRARLRC